MTEPLTLYGEKGHYIIGPFDRFVMPRFNLHRLPRRLRGRAFPGSPVESINERIRRLPSILPAYGHK